MADRPSWGKQCDGKWPRCCGSSSCSRNLNVLTVFEEGLATLPKVFLDPICLSPLVSGSASSTMNESLVCVYTYVYTYIYIYVYIHVCVRQGMMTRTTTRPSCLILSHWFLPPISKSSHFLATSSSRQLDTFSKQSFQRESSRTIALRGRGRTVVLRSRPAAAWREGKG